MRTTEEEYLVVTPKWGRRSLDKSAFLWKTGSRLLALTYSSNSLGGYEKKEKKKNVFLRRRLSLSLTLPIESSMEALCWRERKRRCGEGKKDRGGSEIARWNSLNILCPKFGRNSRIETHTSWQSTYVFNDLELHLLYCMLYVRKHFIPQPVTKIQKHHIFFILWKFYISNTAWQIH